MITHNKLITTDQAGISGMKYYRSARKSHISYMRSQTTYLKSKIWYLITQFVHHYFTTLCELITHHSSLITIDAHHSSFITILPRFANSSFITHNSSLLTFFCFFFVSHVSGQQLPVLNQSLFNTFVLNPANAGLKPYTQLYFSVRDQWSSMPGSPFYYSLSAEGQLRKDRSGIGFQLQGDHQPIIRNIAGLFTYRYTVKFNENHALRMALSAGLLYNSINLTDIDASSPTESTLREKKPSKAGFDMNAGLIYQYKDFELGFAAFQLNNNYFRYINSATDDGLTYRLIRCFNASAKYRFRANKDWDITPAAVLYSTQGMPAYVLASVKIDFIEDYWLAVGYRTDQSLAFSCGMTISGRLNLGYSFELPVNKYASAIGNTHEVTLGIRLFARGSEPASRREASRKDMEQLSETIRLQSQHIDEISQQTERLKDDATKQQIRYDSQRAEIETLIARSVAQREVVEQLKEKENVQTPEQLDSVALTPEAGRYIVVVGAYNSLDDAKLYQKILERECGLVTWVHARKKGNVRFLVYSSIVKAKKEAQSEYDRLYNLKIEQYKQGSLWLYKLSDE